MKNFLTFTCLLIGLTIGSSAQTPPPPTPVPVDTKVKSASPLVVPAYSLVKLTLSNTSGSVDWLAFSSVNNQVTSVSGVTTDLKDSAGKVTGSEFIFTGPPGQYLVIATNNGIHTQTNVTIQAPGNNPQPTPAPPNPAPANGSGDFVYPPIPAPTGQNSVTWKDDLTKTVANVLISVPDRTKVANDAKALSILYNALASDVELDGLHKKPAYTSINQVTLLVKNQESELLASQSLQSLKEIYPDISKKAGETFVNVMKPWQASDKLGPKAREVYVSFLRSLAAGFQKVLEVQ